MIRKILVPLDGSPTSESVLPYVEMLLGIADSNVTLLQVMDPYRAEQEPVMRAYLNGAAERLRGKGAYVDSVVLSGTPAHAISNFAANSRFDMVAMCTHGRSGLARLFMGSVTEETLRHLTVPALVVHPLQEGERPVPFRSILIPLDGSHRSASVIPHAAVIARAVGAHVDFVTVISPTGGEALPTKVAASNIERERKALQDQGLEAGTTILFGDPATEILQAAESRHASLLAISSHGRSGLDRLMYGSVAESILRKSAIPVLLLRTAAVVKPHALHPTGVRAAHRALEMSHDAEKREFRGPYNR